MTQTQPSPAPIQAPAPPVPTRPVLEPRCSPMPVPPRPLARPMQQVLPTPPVVHAFCHMPRQALAPPCQPQVSVQSKQRRILDPFEAAILREQADQEQTVAAAPEPSPYKQFPAAAPALQEDDDDLVKDLEDAMSTAEAEEQTVVAALQDEDEDDNWDDLAKELEIEE
ncbi:unnamed protein product [Miscanthus lutarioriparius]|uniref:Uncharacterized protein n=1 Tax=Miscanthus lutarioriparius TaxID=422564 RepID=A0A811RG17_9POAL|nr:unnamed protein product [Miscanthus lutarioriparius]